MLRGCNSARYQAGFLLPLQHACRQNRDVGFYYRLFGLVSTGVCASLPVARAPQNAPRADALLPADALAVYLPPPRWQRAAATRVLRQAAWQAVREIVWLWRERETCLAFGGHVGGKRMGFLWRDGVRQASHHETWHGQQAASVPVLALAFVSVNDSNMVMCVPSRFWLTFNPKCWAFPSPKLLYGLSGTGRRTGTGHGIFSQHLSSASNLTTSYNIGPVCSCPILTFSFSYCLCPTLITLSLPASLSHHHYMHLPRFPAPATTSTFLLAHTHALSL